MKVHLVDGTYELFRHDYAVPSHINRDGQEVAAVRGVLGSMLALLEEDAAPQRHGHRHRTRRRRLPGLHAALRDVPALKKAM